ncbi:DUF6049 family protein [Microlunatus aurantiacus]|uniref:DUF6049 family protein n=1 Tax=Microlunatus aurantiacus TaxID=446786 RepID=A0ABP7DDK5_9ACTN
MRAVRALLATLLVTVIGLPVLVAAPLLTATTAHAAEPEAWARVSIDQVSPALPSRDQPDEKVTLSGRVTNTSDVELSNLQVAFWRSLDPIETAEGMTAALASAANDPLGARALGGSLFVNVPSEDDRTLEPDESTSFTITATLAQLELPDIDGIYLIGVHLRGRTDSVGPDITVGRGRTFLPVVSETPKEKVRQTSVVVLSSRPSLVRTGYFADDHLVDELSGDGRLTRLLEAAGAQGTSFAIDPALVQEVQAMVAGYRVLSDDGTSREGTGAAAAQTWLSRLAGLITSGDGYRLPYGNPDVTALVHDGDTGRLREAVRIGAQVPATAGLRLLVLPGNGTADEETVQAVAALDPAVILLSDATIRTATAIDSPVLRGPAGSTLVRYTAGASGGGPGPAPRSTPAKVQQRMLADTWIAARSAPEGSPAGRVRVVTDPNQTAGRDNEVAAPWLAGATLTQLLTATPAAWSGEYRYTAGARDAELTAAQLAAARGLSEQFGTYTDLLVEPRVAQADAAIALPRSVSLSWRDDETRSQRYTSTVEDYLDDVLYERISLGVIPRVSTTGRLGTFPITVRNDLPAGADPDTNAIKVRIVFGSSASQRLTVAPIDIARVDAGQTVTVDAQVQAETNGSVRVRAQLQSPDGISVGRSKPVEVTATQAGTIGWLIAIAAGIVLVGTTVLRIRQVGRERAAEEHEPEPLAVSRPPDRADAPDGSKDTLDV